MEQNIKNTNQQNEKKTLEDKRETKEGKVKDCFPHNL